MLSIPHSTERKYVRIEKSTGEGAFSMCYIGTKYIRHMSGLQRNEIAGARLLTHARNLQVPFAKLI